MSDDIVERLRGELDNPLDNPLLKEAADEIMRLVLVAEKYHREVKRLRDELRAANIDWNVDRPPVIDPFKKALTDIVEINCEHDWTQIDHNGDRLMWPVCSECGAPMPPHLEAPTDER